MFPIRLGPVGFLQRVAPVRGDCFAVIPQAQREMKLFPECSHMCSHSMLTHACKFTLAHHIHIYIYVYIYIYIYEPETFRVLFA